MGVSEPRRRPFAGVAVAPDGRHIYVVIVFSQAVLVIERWLPAVRFPQMVKRMNAFFANVVNRLQTGQPVQPVTQLVDPHVILSLPGLVRPLSRGWVRLRSENPTVGRVEKQVIGRVLIRSAAATGAWVLIHHERHNSPYATTVWLLAPRRDRSQIPAPYTTIFSRFWHIYCHGSLP
jgi:hypothetical protein